MKNRIVRLAAGGALAFLVSAPMTQPSSAFVCDPRVRDVCNTVCSHATRVCSLFG